MGLLAKLCPTVPGVDTLLYTVPAGKKAVVNVSVVNRASVTAEPRLAVVKDSDFSVSTVTVTNIGSGCTVIPTLSIVGDYSTRATLAVEHMGLATATLNSAGANYTVGDTLTVEIAGATAVTKAIITVVSVTAAGAITAINISDSGRYTVLGTSATVTGGTGVGATFNIMTYGVKSVLLTNAGNGYKSVPVAVSNGGVNFACSFTMTQTVESDDYFEIGEPLRVAGVLERTGLPLSAGQSLFINTSVGGALNSHVWGLETLA